jgi:1,4-dihydroxy-2-naphthoate octaprenyltransferase
MLNVAMWGRALSVIPRISKEEWAELDIVSRWLIATRSAVLVMTAISAVIAGLLAFRDGAFDPLLFGLCMVGLTFAHASRITRRASTETTTFARNTGHNRSSTA